MFNAREIACATEVAAQYDLTYLQIEPYLKARATDGMAFTVYGSSHHICSNFKNLTKEILHD